MSTLPRVRATVMLGLLALAACADIAATNPYDPGTPADQQAHGSIRALVTLPARFAPSLRAGGVARLRATVANGSTAQDLQLGDDGLLRFSDVPAGEYRVEVEVPLFYLETRVARLAIGEDADLGEVALLPIDAGDSGSGVRGKATRGGAAEGRHGGILVGASGTPYSALTSSDGAYLLSLPAATYTLELSAEGYGTQHLEGVKVADGGITTAGDVVLPGQPGTVRGALVLPAGYRQDRVVDAIVQLAPAAAAAPADAPSAQATPGPDGAFVFESVAPGDWHLSAELTGFDTATARFGVRPGEDVDRGEIGLVPVDGRGHLAGTALLGGAPADGHAGTEVVTDDAPFLTTTREDGTFDLAVPPGRYALSFTHEGYGTERRENLDVAPDETTRVADPVTLIGEPASIRGTAVLPAGLNDPERLRRVAVELTAPTDGAAALPTQNPDPDGTFLLTPVPAGEWRLTLSLPGFEDATQVVRPSPGDDLDVGRVEVHLVPVPDDGSGLVTAIVGRVLLQGAPEDGNGGIVVESLGNPFVTTTTRSGDFQLPVTPESHEVAFTRHGFLSQTIHVPVLAIGQVYPLPDAVTLPALPGSVRGAVTLERFGDAARLETVAISATSGGGDAHRVSPGEDGTFLIDPLPAGAYELTVSALGYEPQTRAIEVRFGEATDAGVIALRHDSDGPGAVTFGGRIRLDDGLEPAGSVVRARIAGLDLPFRTALTGLDGRFEMPASSAETYRFTVERPGYLIPAAIAAAVFHYDGASTAFLDERGLPADYVLAAVPLDGHLEVPIEVRPAWLPDLEKRGLVRVTGDGYQQTQPATAATPAVFDGVPAGTYVVSVERAGFGTQQTFVTLGAGRDRVTVDPPLTLSLVDLTTAHLPLEGETLPLDTLDADVNLAGANLSGVRLTGDAGPRDLSNANLSNADLTGARLAGTRLDGATLFGANLEGTDLAGASLQFANFFSASLQDVDLAGANLRLASFASANLRGARFTAARRVAGRLEPAEPQPARPCDPDAARPAVNLQGVTFTGADLTDAFLPGVDLSGADLGGARLRGADLRTACVQGGDFTLADLSEARADGADLAGARLTNTILGHTSLRGVGLRDATLLSAIMERADFGCRDEAADGACACALGVEAWDAGGACAPDAEAPDLRCGCRTQLTGANLNGANLVGTRFDGAILDRVTLLGVSVGDAVVVPARQPGDCVLPVGCAWADRASCVPAELRACLVTRTSFRGARFDAAEMGSLVLDHVDLAGARGRATNLARAVFPACDLAGADLARADLSQADLSSASVVGARFAGADLTAANLRLRSLRDANFDGAVLVEANLDQTRALRTSFVGADLTQAVFRPLSADDVDFTRARLVELRERGLDSVTMTRARLNGADLTGTSLAGAVLRGAELRQATMGQEATGVRLEGADLTDAHWPSANLRDANLTGATLSGANLSGGNLDRTQLAEVVAIRVDLSGSIFSRVSLARADLSDADLSDVQTVSPLDATGAVAPRADFTGARLSGALLAGANLAAAHLDGALLDSADLTGGNLAGAGLARTDLTGANLTGADLTGCDLQTTVISGTRFSRANLSGLDLRSLPAGGVGFLLDGSRLVGANLAGVDFRYADLSGADLTGADLTGALLAAVRTSGALFARVRFTNAFLENVVMANQDLRGCDFTGARVKGADMNHSVLDGVSLTSPDDGFFHWLNLDGASLVGATLLGRKWVLHAQGADLSGASLSGLEIDSSDFTGATVAGVSLDRSTFSRTTLDGLDLSGRDLSSCTFSDVGFVGANLARAVVAGQWPNVDLTSADLTDVDLRSVTMVDDYVPNVTRHRTSLQGATLTRTRVGVVRGFLFRPEIPGTRLVGLDFATADLSRAAFEGVEMSGCSFGGATLAGSRWTNVRAWGTDFRGARFAGMTVAGSTQLEGVGALDLAGILFADLAATLLVLSDFSGVDFRGRAVSPQVSLAGAADGANFSGTDMSRRLFLSSARNASFVGATLTGCRIDLSVAGADFTSAVLDESLFARARALVQWQEGEGLDVQGARFCESVLADPMMFRDTRGTPISVPGC